MSLHLTEDELIAYLKNSDLNTIIVEGKDDATIYRWLEEEIGNFNISVMPCQGRDTLLKIFERKNEIQNIKIAFIADKDKYVYTGVPDNYSDIIWTNGYSIENDLYYGGYLESLLDKSEKENFKKALDNFIIHYSVKIDQIRKGFDEIINYHPNVILSETYELKTNIELDENIELIFNEIKESYQLLIRGKSLFSILLLILSHKNRAVRHKKSSLMEICLKCNTENLIPNLAREATKKILLPPTIDTQDARI
jgi:hypothetical protein